MDKYKSGLAVFTLKHNTISINSSRDKPRENYKSAKGSHHNSD